jgi:hypothetical protein
MQSLYRTVMSSLYHCCKNLRLPCTEPASLLQESATVIRTEPASLLQESATVLCRACITGARICSCPIQSLHYWCKNLQLPCTEPTSLLEQPCAEPASLLLWYKITRISSCPVQSLHHLTRICTQQCCTEFASQPVQNLWQCYTCCGRVSCTEFASQLLQESVAVLYTSQHRCCKNLQQSCI